MGGTSEFVRAALRRDIDEALAQCTEEQRARWPRIFPNGLDEADESTLRSAHALCQRTLAANARKTSEVER